MVLTLTDRERQVIGPMIAEGLSNREIGERLFITERTVCFHVTSIFNTLGADNPAQAVAIANRLSLFWVINVFTIGGRCPACGARFDRGRAECYVCNHVSAGSQIPRGGAVLGSSSNTSLFT